MSEALVEQPKETEATDPVERTSDAMMRDQWKRMDKPVLLDYLENTLGYIADPDLTKEDLAANIVKLNRDRIEQAQVQTREVAMAVATKDDPLVRVTFQNLESPGTDLEFAYGSAPRRIDRKGDPKPGKIPTYHLVHNETADLPYSVYQHLRSLKVPENKFVMNEGGFIKAVSKGWARRFAVELDLTPEQMKKIGIGS